MEGDGALIPAALHTGSGAGSLLLFANPAPKAGSETAFPDSPLLRDSPSGPAASAAVLEAIEQTALRYAGHDALRRAGLSASGWARLFRANIEVESGYRLDAVSAAGAIGPGQLMPATARDLGVDPQDWRANLDGSARYLLQMLDLFGTPALALAAYNAGPEALRRHGGIPPFAETRSHVARVNAVFARLQREV